MLFIDNPADAGYSYAPREKDTYTSDASFSRDIVQFMLMFFKDYNIYGNPMYFVGISYGGNFAPYATWAMHQFNME